jgi:hypothetical protein
MGRPGANYLDIMSGADEGEDPPRKARTGRPNFRIFRRQILAIVTRKQHIAKAKRAYRLHEFNAAKRNIPFEISFEDWLRWWEENLGPNWLTKRGRRLGQHAMARNGDTGPHKLGNIHCATCSENNREHLDIQWQDPDYRAAQSARMIGNKHTPKAANSAAMKRKWQDPDYRAAVRARMMGNKHTLGHTLSPEHRAKSPHRLGVRRLAGADPGKVR